MDVGGLNHHECGFSGTRPQWLWRQPLCYSVPIV
jgi:hypothetical protein